MMSLVSASAVGDADWLTGERALRLARLLALVLGCCVIAGGVLILLSYTAAKPMALDFDAFWAAARLAVTGHAEAAYDNAAIEATERAATVMAPGYLAFYYPPPFLLVCLPLGLLGFTAALAAFLATELALLIALLRRILPQSWAWLPLLSFPGFLMNGLSGQNAPLTAACFAGAALWLDARPILAGIFLGGLVCKPQLAVCVPLALLAARRLRVLVACGATAAASCLLSWAVLGTGVWRGFLLNAPNARADIETIAIKWPKLQSAFGMVRLSGGGNGLAYELQAVVSATAVLVLLLAAWRRPGAQIEAALMVCAALLFTPFLYDYDLAVLCVPMAALMAAAQRGAWLGFEKYVLLAVFLLPLAARPCGMALGVIIGPPFVAGLMALLIRRALRPAVAA
jgi:alpha-1,2-mannosyltransferase